MGYMREPNGVESFSDGGWSFQGQAYMQTDVCGPGLLKILADGESALNVFPELQIDLDSVPLATIKVGRTKQYTVTIPRAGHLTLGYFNDYYKADVRVAIIRRVTVSNCSVPPKLVLLGTSGGTVDTTMSLATLYSSNRIRIIPCASGNIELRLSGRSGGAAFPIIRFLSTNKEVARFQTTELEQKITLAAIGPLDVELLNPYAKLVGDRNLNLRKINFVSR